MTVASRARSRWAALLALLALPLAGCAPVIDAMTMDEWLSSLDGLISSSTSGVGVAGQPFEIGIGSLGEGSHDVLLDCRSRAPVEMKVADLDPVEVVCGTTTTVTITVDRLSIDVPITATAAEDAWISVRVLQDDAFVDGAPAEP